MGYYIRVLTKNSKIIYFSRLECCLKNKGIKAKIKLEEVRNDIWNKISLNHINEEIIAIIERNLVKKGQLGEDEIKEFLDEIIKCKPKSAVKWLKNYLNKVKIIYAIQVFSGAYKNKGWETIRAIQTEIWSNLRGIIQSDNEGFSNEEGYHILWQFPDNVKGPWQMAVLDKHRKWIKFEMDLGNKNHRKAFLAGKIPKGVKII